MRFCKDAHGPTGLSKINGRRANESSKNVTIKKGLIVLRVIWPKS